jgi:hypothetical protein
VLAVVSPSRMLSDIAQVLAVPSFVIVVTQVRGMGSFANRSGWPSPHLGIAHPSSPSPFR